MHWPPHAFLSISQSLTWSLMNQNFRPRTWNPMREEEGLLAVLALPLSSAGSSALYALLKGTTGLLETCLLEDQNKHWIIIRDSCFNVPVYVEFWNWVLHVTIKRVGYTKYREVSRQPDCCPPPLLPCSPSNLSCWASRRPRRATVQLSHL